MARFIKTAVGALITANVAMFAILKLVVISGVGSAAWLGVSPGLWPWIWTPLTYMVTNTGFLDLLFNCLWLWLFSTMLLEIGSERQLLLSYLFGGLAGAGLFLAGAAMGLCGGILFGASGAVLGVMSFAVVRVPYMRLNLMFFGAVKFMWIGIIAAALSLLPLLTGDYAAGLAHLGGIIGGAGYALSLKLRRKTRFRIMRPGEKKTLDELLDKVRRSGYASLNADERRQLLEYSNKL